MIAEVRCMNVRCGHPSRLGADELGRTFRCARCGSKLPRGLSGIDASYQSSLPPVGLRSPWEAARGARGSRQETAPAMPRRFGRFEIRGMLGAGSCATVFRAFDPALEREVALKVPHPGVLRGAKARARFEGEAKALARLRHPAIVPIYETGRFGEMPYLATAFIAGRTLAEVLEAGPFGCNRAAEVAIELAEALGYAHGLGIVHRDVKPANVLIEPAGGVHLTDFGLAHRRDAAKLTREGALIGTPAYLAPEQSGTQSTPAHPLVDQYALGVVLYEMLAGRPPFLGPPSLVIYSARYDPPLAPRSLRADVPRPLERICLKAMARRPEDRYPTCLALADDLRRWLDGDAVEADVSGPPLTRAMDWLRRRSAILLTGILG